MPKAPVDPSIAARVAEKLRSQFPEWVAANEAAKKAEAAKHKSEHVEFLLVSNWTLRPEGLQEILTKLREHDRELQVTYHQETASPKIKCLASREDELMAICQSAMDDMVRREVAVGWDTSNKIARASDWRTNANNPSMEETMLALAPPEILGSAARALWTIPEKFLKQGSPASLFVLDEALRKVRRLTGCTIAASDDGRAVFISADSQDRVALAERKLATLTKYAVPPSQAITRCESFIYAEDEQDGLGTFTYVAHGAKSILTTFFFDRVDYRLEEGSSLYGKIFEGGVVVSLYRDSLHPTAGVIDITPAIPNKAKNEQYKAFSSALWDYTPKANSCGLGSYGKKPLAPFDPGHNSQIASWVTRLTKPELMLSPEDRSQTPTVELRRDGERSPSLTPDQAQPKGPHLERPAGQPDPILTSGKSQLARGALSPTRQSITSQQTEELSDTYTANTDERKPLDSWVPPHLRSKGFYAQLTGADISPEAVAGKSEAIPVGQKWPLINIDEDDEGTILADSGTQGPRSSHVPKTMPGGAFASEWNGLEADSRVEKEDKQQPRHNTMRQQAGYRPNRKQDRQEPQFMPSDKLVRRDPDPELMLAMTQKLVLMMGSLEAFNGKVSLKADLGRFCLMKINHSYVHVQGSNIQSQARPLKEIKEALDKRHVNHRDVVFTNILTGEGGDANYLTFMKDHLGKRIWSPDGRRTIYEITCCAKTGEDEYHRFVIEVDANKFTYRIHELLGQSCSLFVHCPKRAWDFRVTLSRSHDFGETYGNFAKDLVDNMRVLPQNSGAPLLEFTVKREFSVEILLVRTRNIGSYVRTTHTTLCSPSDLDPENTPTSSLLEVCEMHDMSPRNVIRAKDKVTAVFEPFPGNQRLGMLPIWYEVSLQSKAINEALQQNRDLEVGEEVTWSPEQLQKAGAVYDLLRSATEMVKKADGVGYWGDNCQDAMIHPMPPTSYTGTSQYGSVNTSRRSVW